MINYQDKKIPQEKWIPEKLWKTILKSIPLPCLDVFFQRNDGSILYGYRIIQPYRNVWASLGGRMLHGENLMQAAIRIGSEYGLGFKELYLIGIFPINFEYRSDIVIATAARNISGVPIVDGKEFSKMVWLKRPPNRLGANYKLMVSKWFEAKRLKTFIKLNRIT